MKPYQVLPLTDGQKQELEAFYHQTRDARQRLRAHRVLLAAEQRMNVQQIADVVRESPSRVLRCLKRYETAGLAGLTNKPRRGRPRRASTHYQEKLLVVRRRPRSLGLDFSVWTLDLLVEYSAQELGKRVSRYTVWRRLREAGIVFSHPQHAITSSDLGYLLKKDD